MTTSTGRERPWRAVAFIPDATAPNGRRREVAGRTAAKTRAGLQRFIDRQEAAGNAVDLWEVAPFAWPDGTTDPDTIAHTPQTHSGEPT